MDMNYDVEKVNRKKPKPEPGSTWQHNKGGVYTVVSVGMDADRNVDVVVYRDELGQTWVRSLNSWYATSFVNGQQKPRFVQV